MVPSEVPPDTARLVTLAEEKGYDYLWIPDDRLERDPFVTLTFCASSTKVSTLGTAVTNPYARHPAQIARAIASVDEISFGRTVLGLGAGGPDLVRALCLKRKDPTSICKEAIHIIRELMRGEPFSYEGRFWKINQGLLDLPPSGPRMIPIYLAARGPRMLQTAGEVADGVIIGDLLFDRTLKFALNQVKIGAERAGRRLEDIDLVLWMRSAISDNAKAAKALLRSTVAGVIANVPDAILDESEITKEERSLIKKHYISGSAVDEIITNEHVEKFSLTGSPSECTKRIEQFVASGVNQIAISPRPMKGYGREKMLRLFAERIIPRFK